jgi:hypothetical protein
MVAKPNVLQRKDALIVTRHREDLPSIFDKSAHFFFLGDRFTNFAYPGLNSVE